MFTIIPAAVRDGLFSPSDTDKTGEELPFSPHLIHTIFVCASGYMYFYKWVLKGSKASVFFVWASLGRYKLFETFFRKQNKVLWLQGCKSFLRSKPQLHSFQLLRETNLCALFINQGVIPFSSLSFQPQFKIRYSGSCPQISSVVN